MRVTQAINRFSIYDADLEYPYQIDFLKSLAAIRQLPRPRRFCLRKVSFPESAEAYIASRDWIATHPATCTCERCKQTYSLPAGGEWKAEFEILNRLGAGSFGATALLEVLRGPHDHQYGVPNPILATWPRCKFVAGDVCIAIQLSLFVS